MTTLLQQAIDLAKSGNREEAEVLLQRVVAEQPDNEVAWMWLSGVSRDKSVKLDALKKALSLNPDNALAKRGLIRFEESSEAVMPSDTPSAGAPPTTGSPSEGAGADLERRFPSDIEADIEADIESDVEPSLTERSPSFPTQEPPSDGGLDLSFMEGETTAEGTGQAEENDFSFDFDFEEEEAASPPAAEETAGDQDAFDWGAFDFDTEAPFNFNLDDTDRSSEASPDSERDVNELDFGFNWSEDEAPATEADSEQDINDRFAALFGSDTDATEAAQTETEASSEDPETFNWDDASAFDFEAEGPETDPADEPPETGAGTQVDLAARLGGLAGTPESDEGAEAPVGLTEADVEVKEEDIAALAQATAVAKQRQQKQQLMLIWGVLLFVFVVLIAVVTVLFDDVVGRYTVIPPPEELTKEVPASRDGTATVNFNGYPAARANIKWTRANDVETCSGSGTGLSINFGTGDTSIISNQVCLGDSCGFEKNDLNRQPVTRVTVTHVCSQDAVITLFVDGQ